MSTAYKITDPDVVSAYLEAQHTLRDWKKTAHEYAENFPGVVGYLRRHFGDDYATLVLKPERSGMSPQGLPEGWRYVKTRDSVEPKLHKAGEAAREEFAPYRKSPAQPSRVLSEAKVPTVILDADQSMFYTVVHFEHDGAIWLKYGGNPKDERIPDIMQPIKTSEWHAAREALDEQERS